MRNLYTTRVGATEIAPLSDARVSAAGTNAGHGSVYPGGPGMVVRQVDGARSVDGMTWGFPLRIKGMKPGSKPKPVNNARADKRDGFKWRYSIEERRCLIPAAIQRSRDASRLFSGCSH
jgi:putative SOS response-associated peptidase YedK